MPIRVNEARKRITSKTTFSQDFADLRFDSNVNFSAHVQFTLI